MDTSDVNRWFGAYLDAFAACGRGVRDATELLAYRGVPQIDGMRAAGAVHGS